MPLIQAGFFVIGLAIGYSVFWLIPEALRVRRARRRDRIDALVDRARSGDRSAVDEAINSKSIRSPDWIRVSDAFYHEGGLERHYGRPTAGGAMSLAAPVEPKPHDPWLLKELLAGLEQGGPEQVQRWLKPEKAKAELGPNEVRRNRFIYYEPPLMTPWVVPSGTTTQFNWTVDPATTTSTVLTTTTNTT